MLKSLIDNLYGLVLRPFVVRYCSVPPLAFFCTSFFLLLRIFYLSPGFALAVRILSLFSPELHLLRQEGVSDLSWQAEAKGAGSSPHVFLTFTALRFNMHIYFR